MAKVRLRMLALLVVALFASACDDECGDTIVTGPEGHVESVTFRVDINNDGPTSFKVKIRKPNNFEFELPVAIEPNRSADTSLTGKNGDEFGFTFVKADGSSATK